MRAVITVIGKDSVGILAKVSTGAAECHANIIEVTQTVMQELFAMIMLVDVSALSVDFSEFVDRMKKLGDAAGLTVHVMHESIFDSMHRI